VGQAFNDPTASVGVPASNTSTSSENNSSASENSDSTSAANVDITSATNQSSAVARVANATSIPQGKSNSESSSSRMLKISGWAFGFITMLLAAIALLPGFLGDDTAKKALSLAQWTALKDYREQCKELLVGLSILISLNTV
jgi:hypothetical protein